MSSDPNSSALGEPQSLRTGFLRDLLSGLDRGGLRMTEVFTAVDGRVRMRGEAKAYIARYRDACGVWIEHPTGCTDVTAARAILGQLQRRAELIRAGVIATEEDDALRHGTRLIDEHLARGPSTFAPKAAPSTGGRRRAAA